ncbi:MAG: DUF1189 family protein [Alphaproteobacteria bacterium]|nr:DUF1189 family protein [Alphaproteobacteria bacterium]
MYDTLLNRKWIGAIALVVYAVIVSMFFTNMSASFVKQTIPVVEQEIDGFLPITVSGGEIVAPRDTIIDRTYGSNYNVRKVVLDTRTDEFETSGLKDKGLYISRKYIYIVSDSKTEIHDFKNVPDIVVDSEVLHSAAEYIQEKSGRYIFSGIVLFFLMFSAAAIGLYSLAMHWALSGIFHNEFRQTLRINTFAYIVVSALTMIIGYNIGIVATFVILFGVNYGVNKWLQEEKKAA